MALSFSLWQSFRSRAAVRNLVHEIGASYWFVPLALTFGAIVLARVMVNLDIHVDALPVTIPPSFTALSVDGARAIMSIIATSVFSVTGVMYSMTIVAVSFASGNFGPRLIGNFMRDRVNQWSLGTLIATFVYALFVSRSIEEPQMVGSEARFVPHLAMLLTLVCIVIVIYFVHHVPKTINISEITGKLGRRLVTDLRCLARTQAERDGEGFDPREAGEPDDIVRLGINGYVQAIDLDALREIAQDHDLRIAIDVPTGEYLTDATRALRIWGERPPDEELVTRIRRCFAIGPRRIIEGNAFFLVDQLVEIAVRALSPGVNDPFTANNCLNWIQAALVAAANEADGLTGAIAGPVHIRPIRFEEVLQRSLGAVRSYAMDDPITRDHFRGVLDRLANEVQPGPHAETLRLFTGRALRAA